MKYKIRFFKTIHCNYSSYIFSILINVAVGEEAVFSAVNKWMFIGESATQIRMSWFVYSK